MAHAPPQTIDVAMQRFILTVSSRKTNTFKTQLRGVVTHRKLRNVDINSRQSCQHGTENLIALQNKVLEDVFSQQNKSRCQEQLKNVKPARGWPPVWKMKGKVVEQAAVLIALCTYKGEPSLLYTVRAADLSSHRGQVR